MSSTVEESLSLACVAHIDEPETMAAVMGTLADLHGPGYGFSLERWDGPTEIAPRPGRTVYLFVVESAEGRIELAGGERVAGAPAGAGFRPGDDGTSLAAVAQRISLWPGDVVAVDGRDGAGALLDGQGTGFQVVTEATAYRPPRLVLLRGLTSHPGGCAAYPGAFRREALPPRRPDPAAADQRGANRVNEHTLDMRHDRDPHPIRHAHGPIPVGDGVWVNHSETAIVLSRAAYGLPAVGDADQGRVVLYRRPHEDPTDRVVVPVRPGSIVVTPATPGFTYGHCFEDAFAMLVAIPGFVAPYHMIEPTPHSEPGA